MARKFDKDTVSEAVGSTLKKTGEFGKDLAKHAQKQSAQMLDKSKSDRFMRRLKKYNPLFPDQYLDPSFTLPAMLVITDGNSRRDIDVCVGAIGWHSVQNGLEVLHLYEEAVQTSGLEFIPSARRDAIYYVDHFNSKRFINIESIFDVAHEERLAELKHIAHALGAIRCTIKISESNVSTNRRIANKKLSAGKKHLGLETKTDAFAEADSQNHRYGSIVAEFEGSHEAVRPTLKWFKQHDSMTRLIDMRCNNIHSNSIKRETIEISGSAQSTMSQKAAYTIDGAIQQLGAKGSYALESSAKQESNSKLIFHIEFP